MVSKNSFKKTNYLSLNKCTAEYGRGLPCRARDGGVGGYGRQQKEGKDGCDEHSSFINSSGMTNSGF